MQESSSKKQEIIIWKQGIQEITVHGLRVTVQVTGLDSDSSRSVQAKIMKTTKKHENTSKKHEIIIWMQGIQEISVHGEPAQGAQAAP